MPHATRLRASTRTWMLVCLFLASLPAVTPRLYSSDEIQYFAYLRSLWFDHDLSFDNEYRYFYDRGVARSDGFRDTFLELKTDTGKRINFGTIGCALLWSPFYAAGDLAARLTHAPRDGFSQPYLAAVAYGSAFYGFTALLLAGACAKRLGLEPFAAILVVWLGTPLLFYMYVAPPFSHACSAFAVALFTYTWLRVRTLWSARGLAALGAAAGLMAMVREQDAFFAVAVAIDFLVRLVAPHDDESPTPKRSLLIAAAAGLVAGVIVYLPQAFAYLSINGHLGPHASVGAKMHWTGPHALQVLFSPAHGFFVWTPIAMIAIAGVAALAARGATRIGILLLLMVALQIWIGGSVESWTVAGGFAQRRFVALTTALVIGYAVWWTCATTRAARTVLLGITVAAVYWNLALTAEFAVGLMDRQQLQPATNAYDALVTLPRMAPGLVYRYFFDRRSFYKRADPLPR